MKESYAMKSSLLKREKELNALHQELCRRRQSYPDGILKISERKGKPYFYLITASDKKLTESGTGKSIDRKDRQWKYLRSTDTAIVPLLAQKSYEKKVIGAVEKELSAIREFLARFPDTTAEMVYDMLSDRRKKYVHPVMETDEIYLSKWMGKEYAGKSFTEDSPEFLTDKGERVRSKSEVIIANMLDKEGIPYHYECPLTLRGYGTVYPDFTILNLRSRKELYWEHFGMMDDPDYANKALLKIATYTRNHIYPGSGLIITAETRQVPLNTQTIKEMIRYYLR